MRDEHYLAVDVGATKTLLAVFSPDGNVIFQQRIPTSQDYAQFKNDLNYALAELKKFNVSRACIAIPGVIDLEHGVAAGLGNRDWQNIPIKADFEAMLPGVRILIHNDAKLAGLSETILLHKKYKKVLYVTISTGIGGGVITNDVIDNDFVNFEPGQMVFEYQGELKQWEDIASGRNIVSRYGKKAAEIDDPAIWQEYTRGLIAGFEDLLATIQPDAVIIGGGVGAHFEKFKPYLEEGLKQINNPLVPVPPFLKAQRPEEAVIYGCYDYINQNL